MSNQTELIYTEQQKFSPWLRWLIAASMVLSIPISVFAIIKINAEQNSSALAAIIPLLIAGIFVPLAFALLFGMLKLQTQVRPDGLYIRFFPFHINFKRFTAEDLTDCYARQYKPVAEYGGWGIRFSIKSGKAYNTAGNKGVQLVLKNGKHILIGSQNPKELEKAIRSTMEKNTDTTIKEY